MIILHYSIIQYTCTCTEKEQIQSIKLPIFGCFQLKLPCALASSQPPPKYAPNVTLSTPQKLAKLAAMAHEEEASSCKVGQLEDCIAKLTAVNGIDVGKKLMLTLRVSWIHNQRRRAVHLQRDAFSICSGSSMQMEPSSATSPQQWR